MFYSDLAETNDPIPIPDIQPKVFNILLKYIYTDTDDIKIRMLDIETVYELWYCANKYILSPLIRECTTHLKRNLSSKNVCRVYECAKFFNELELMNECLDAIRAQTSEVLKESSWEDVELETLVKLLEQDYLQIDSEMELFTALERWAKSECSRKSLDPTNGECLRSVIGNALLKIRFLNMTREEFINGPGSSPLLTEDESYAILNHNIKPMPKGFCTESRSRKNPVIRVTKRGNNFVTFVTFELDIESDIESRRFVTMKIVKTREEHVQDMEHNGT